MAEQEQRGQQQGQHLAPAPAAEQTAAPQAGQEPGRLLTAEELDRAMKLPLSLINNLPAVQQKQVWAEMGRLFAEAAERLEAAGVEATAQYKADAEAFAAKIPQLHTIPKAELIPLLAQIRRGINNADKLLIAEELRKRGTSPEEVRQRLEDAINTSRYQAEIIREIERKLHETAEMYRLLLPYINAEADEHPELYGEDAAEPASVRDLYRAAARRARADGQDIQLADMIGFEDEPAEPDEPDGKEPQQLEMQLDFPENKPDETSKEEAPAPAGIAQIVLARSAGAITSLDNHVATLADKILQACFTSHGLRTLPGKREDFIFDKAGKLEELSLDKKPLQPLDKVHTGFLMALLQLANISDRRKYNSMDNPSIGVYLPAFFRETGIDPRPRARDKQTGELIARPQADEQSMKELRLQKFIEFMAPLDNRVGIIEGEGYYAVARFLSWEEQTEIAHVSIPFEIKLAELANLHADNHSAIATVFRADILTENQTAVELANRIAIGIIERGVSTPDASTYTRKPRRPIKKKTATTDADGNKTVEELTFAPEPPATEATPPAAEKKKPFLYKVKFATLISKCPQLRGELDAIREDDSPNKSQRINKKLKDIFTAAIRIIMKKSEIPKYYAGFAIRTGSFETFKAPTNSTLNEYLIITHTGKNPAFDPH